VISVQPIVLSIESSQIRRNHNWLKSLSFFSVRLLDIRLLWLVSWSVLRSRQNERLAGLTFKRSKGRLSPAFFVMWRGRPETGLRSLLANLQSRRTNVAAD
jgi:hypothetical protein